MMRGGSDPAPTDVHADTIGAVHLEPFPTHHQPHSHRPPHPPHRSHQHNSPFPTPPHFSHKKYKIKYGCDFIIVHLLLTCLILFGMIYPAILFDLSDVSVWWWLVCAFIGLLLLYSFSEGLVTSFERGEGGYKLKVGCGCTHFIPFNEIAYLRLFDFSTSFINWEAMHGGRSSIWRHSSVQIKSFRPGASILFTPAIGAVDFMRENIPNEDFTAFGLVRDDIEVKRDDTLASLSYLAPVTTKFLD
eukprot:GHVN01025181.1.p1 GENE.GHVN01025181.1~~GHVN01025181.1.p1  ORF type:complete len:245 (+),score=66.23 GHVN01025181.1:331-1065(+)